MNTQTPTIFICTGSIYRSPAAAAIWTAKTGLPAASYACSKAMAGSRIGPRMRRALEAAGYAYDEAYRSQWLGDAKLAAGTLVWGMQPGHLMTARGLGLKASLLSSFIRLPKIPDPCFNPDEDACPATIRQLEACIDALIKNDRQDLGRSLRAGVLPDA